MLNHNIDFDNSQAMHEEILSSNALMLGALAWRGNQLKGRGTILVYALKKSEDAFAESIDIEIGYLSRKEIVQNYPEQIRLFQFLDEYDPDKDIVVTFLDTEYSLAESYCLTLLLPPLKCYILLQEQMLKCDISGTKE